MAKIHLIYARSRNGVIGNKGALPWHLPEDMAHFKRTTMGATVIMGRKTWDSLPAKFRPLPGRRNIVITRQGGWAETGAEVAGSVEEAIALCRHESDAWVIGGAQIYSLALPLADSVVVTEIEAEFEGDAYAPDIGHDWIETASEPLDSAQGLRINFVTYEPMK